jgi:hypothetical protein
MQKEAPGLCRVRLNLKPKLSPKNKQRRIEACKKLLSRYQQQLQWVVWIDAKVLYVDVKHRYGWIDKATTAHEDLPIEHKLCHTKINDCMKLRYYAAVNAVEGHVALIFCTGTTKHTSPTVYMVRPFTLHAPLLAACPPSLPAGPPQWQPWL